MIGFYKYILPDVKRYILIVKCHTNGILCYKCRSNMSKMEYYDLGYVFLCNQCLNIRFKKVEENVEQIIKYHYRELVYYSLQRIKISDIVSFYIGKYVMERNRKHKFERKCYHFHKATCKTIYAFCLFAKRYYPLELNKDVRLKICKLILE